MPRARVVPPKHRVVRNLKKAVASPRGIEAGFGTVASTGTGPRGQIANVYLNGNSATTIPAAYPAGYQPCAGDNVLMMCLGSDSRLKQQWVIVLNFGPSTAFGSCYFVFPSGDTTGDTDTAALLEANTAAHDSGGAVWLGPGAWWVESGELQITQNDVSWIGPGSGACRLYGLGSGELLHAQIPSGQFDPSVSGGTIGGFTIDGTSSSAGFVGLHYGDVINGRFQDLEVIHANQAGSIGLWYDSFEFYSEGTVWDNVRLIDCATCLQMDSHSETSNSLGYQMMMNVRLDANAGQTCWNITSSSSLGCDVYNGVFNVRANLAPHSGSDYATFLTIRGLSDVGDVSLQGKFGIQVEQTGGTSGDSFGIILYDYGSMIGEGTVDLSGNNPQSSPNGNANAGTFALSGRIRMPGFAAEATNQVGLVTAGLQVYAVGSSTEPQYPGLYTPDNQGAYICGRGSGGYVTLQPQGPGVTTGEFGIAANGNPVFTGPTATTATAGSATLPSAPLGFLEATVDGTAVKIPYYSA